jgi:fibronectin type 3 domain-containing protein
MRFEGLPSESTASRSNKMIVQTETSKHSKPTRLFQIVVLAISLTIVSGCRSEHSVTLNWQQAPATQGTKIAGYNIYRATTKGGPYSPIASRVPATSYKDEPVSSGEIYYYVVTSVDDAGHESGYSQEISARVP